MPVVLSHPRRRSNSYEINGYANERFRFNSRVNAAERTEAREIDGKKKKKLMQNDRYGIKKNERRKETIIRDSYSRCIDKVTRIILLDYRNACIIPRVMTRIGDRYTRA